MKQNLRFGLGLNLGLWSEVVLWSWPVPVPGAVPRPVPGYVPVPGAGPGSCAEHHTSDQSNT